MRRSNTGANCAQFLLQKMATMERVQSSLLSDGDYFDMWHDYMNLGRVMEKLCDLREGDPRGDTEAPRRAAAGAGAWSHIQTSRRQHRKNSVGTSSESSLSDSSPSGTSSDFCRFCKQNGESARVYRSHKLKSDDGKVICPVLWNYTCPICRATGDQAHTRRYCPQAQRR